MQVGQTCVCHVGLVVVKGRKKQAAALAEIEATQCLIVGLVAVLAVTDSAALRPAFSSPDLL